MGSNPTPGTVVGQVADEKEAAHLVLPIGRDVYVLRRMPDLASKAQVSLVVRNRGGALGRWLVLCVALIALLAACELQPPDGSLPDISLPDVSTPEETTPEGTAPEETTPEATAPEETTPEASVPEETTPEATEPEVTTPDESDGGEAAPPPEDGEVSPWLWIVLAAVVIALLVGALTRRNSARSATASWTERARSALSGLESIEATLGRPATLDPADHEAMRRSVASARDRSVTFEQLAAKAPDETLAQHAAATADALRVLATSSEIEVESLASGALSTLASREAAEAERRIHLQALHQAAERLTLSLQ